MGKLKFKKRGWTETLEKALDWKETIESFNYEDLFEPFVSELEGVECKYSEIEEGDWFVFCDSPHILRLAIMVGHITFKEYSHDRILDVDAKIINFGKLKTIPEKFTIKIKEPDLPAIADCACGAKCYVVKTHVGFHVRCWDDSGCGYQCIKKPNELEAILTHNGWMEGLKNGN